MCPPPERDAPVVDWNIFRSSWRLVADTMHIRRLFLAIVSISFFWSIGSILFIQFPPLAKNVLTADKAVASLFLGVFSIGIAIGSVAVNRLLKGEVSARYSKASVLVMAGFVVAFFAVCLVWPAKDEGLYSLTEVLTQPMAAPLLLTLLGIAVAGGMFVVPLYAFLTTTVAKSAAARTIAANNIVNALAMVAGSLVALGLSAAGVAVVHQILLSAAMCLVSAWLAVLLHRAESAHV